MEMGDREYSGVWNGIPFTLTQEEYYIAMSHVEHMRNSADEDNYYEEHIEGDDEFIDPYSWKLSDSLSTALHEAPDEGVIETRLKSGLRVIAEKISLFGPCEDDDADEVFGED